MARNGIIEHVAQTLISPRSSYRHRSRHTESGSDRQMIAGGFALLLLHSIVISYFII
ncbi:hypothetical protein ASPWEDRAFT_37068 [Aspergillus wentii DTO 134E9]|uniref:Uncharacterized protein n=1 Tax=Aspergillus wentii DTO 134E9 TaxID=1073089 RepID=A0A1L9RWJ9_ASPWE|nr:uncharacterized protein ASPWEDRAFT_37068 [Aspergillus wentii DTO 134E9]OJJ39309.1 hypothetical protein ASPWEDRAFT_37068 [Aspergillus wentii DTO 134E9]